MDSWNKHVPQISFRQCVTFCEHRQLKGWPPRCSSHMGAQSVYCNNSWDHNSVTEPSASLHATSFSAAATKGWAWCNNAELVKRAAALRDLKLLVGSECLEFQKGMAGMDSWDKHVKQISCWQWVTCFKRGQLKGWQPHFRPSVAKSSISTVLHWLAAVTCHNWEHNEYPVYNPNLGHHHCIVRNKSWRRQLRDQTLCFLAWDRYFTSVATKGWAWCAAALRNLELLVGSGCLEF